MARSIFLLLIVALLVSSCTLMEEKGKLYASFEELKSDQDAKGYILLAKFGNAWPARVREVQIARNEIDFTLITGQNHSYPGYDGYKLKMMRLYSEDELEVVALFRSKEKNK